MARRWTVLAVLPALSMAAVCVGSRGGDRPHPRPAVLRRAVEDVAPSVSGSPVLGLPDSSQEDVSALRGVILSDPDPDERASAVLTLASLGPSARPLLQELYLEERDLQVRGTFESALGGVR